jgi:hypothetical protein
MPDMASVTVIYDDPNDLFPGFSSDEISNLLSALVLREAGIDIFGCAVSWEVADSYTVRFHGDPGAISAITDVISDSIDSRVIAHS